MRPHHILTATCLTLLLFTYCKKDSETGSTPSYPYQVRMTDAPGPYDSVLVDIQGVEITGGGGGSKLLDVPKGIYNLLSFANGADTLLASTTLTDATVSQIRLILGSNNSVVVGGIKYPLSTPSAEQSGLKIQVHQTLLAGITYVVLLDFDANQSIVEQGNGNYKLKPVVRTIEVAVTGAIRGKITPVGIAAMATATSGTDSFSSPVSSTGDFLIRGVPAGTYSVTITPASPRTAVTKNNVTVSNGVVTDAGTIAL